MIELPLAQTTIFGEDVILWDTLFRAVLAVPVLIHFYREDRVFRGPVCFTWKTALIVITGGAALSTLSGVLCDVLQIPCISTADTTLFTGNLWLEALVLLMASPVLEEYFFRGVFYGRLKELVPVPAAILISACCFGIFHWDLVQGIYSFFMGAILAVLMEKTNTVKAPILFHAAANAAALILR